MKDMTEYNLKDIKGVFLLVIAVLKRRYPMPWKTFFLTLLCAIYVLSPMDILPDVLPILGITDDATFIFLVWTCIQKEVAKYRASITEKTPQAHVIDLGDIKDHKK